MLNSYVLRCTGTSSHAGFKIVQLFFAWPIQVHYVSSTIQILRGLQGTSHGAFDNGGFQTLSL